MFNSKKQFLDATKLIHSIEKSSSELSLSQYRDIILKKMFGERFNTNHLEKLFNDNKSVCQKTFFYFEKENVENIYFIIVEDNYEKYRLKVGDGNNFKIIPNEIKKTLKKYPNSVTKLFSDSLYNYVYDLTNSDKMKILIDKEIDDRKRFNLDNDLDAEFFYDLYEVNFLSDMFKDGINIENLGYDVLRISGNHKESLFKVETMFDELRIKDTFLKDLNYEDTMSIKDMVECSLRRVIFDHIGVHLKNFYNNKDSLKRDNDKQKEIFFISEYFKSIFYSWKYNQ
jgi:hypothetical protein